MCNNRSRRRTRQKQVVDTFLTHVTLRNPMVQRIFWKFMVSCSIQQIIFKREHYTVAHHIQKLYVFAKHE